MQHVSQFNAPIKSTITSPEILVITDIFLPQESGNSEYIYSRCLEDYERVLLLAPECENDKEFDKKQIFPIYRWTVNQYLERGIFGKKIKKISTQMYAFFWAIRLYFRYRYKYIEWNIASQVFGILLLSYLLPIRFFLYLNGNDILFLIRNPLRRKLLKLTLKRANGVACNSEFTKDLLERNFGIQIPLHIIRPMMRPEKFDIIPLSDYFEQQRVSLRQRYSISNTAVVILSVSRLVKKKGNHRVIEILTLLLSKGLDVHYIICGRGEVQSELKSLVRRFKLQDRVHFAGYVLDNKLASYYAASDIFTSLDLFCVKTGNIDGFGMSCLEASYFGKPIIASHFGGITDIVRDQENGILVDPNSGYEVFQAFNLLCEDVNLRSQLGAKSREFIQKKSTYRVLYQ
jgi:phosphatidyl-myo-inositol dimannoside synthase